MKRQLGICLNAYWNPSVYLEYEIQPNVFLLILHQPILSDITTFKYFVQPLRYLF